jgi:hypothetical protein
MARTPLFERFLRHLGPRQDNGCILWIGTIDRNGYGEIKDYIDDSDDRQKLRAHRVAWALKHGPIPAGMEVCHTCDNPPCVNDEHLFLGTHADNIKDCAAKGRMTMHRAKILALDIPRMRDMLACGCTQLDVGSWFGVYQSAVSQAVSGKTWSHA